MDYYQKILKALENYFTKANWKNLFMEGGCYWLADTLHRGIPGSYLIINRSEEHCGVYFENGLYDIRGRISARLFRKAKERDICFMKKNYIPKFQVENLEQYLRQCLLL